MAPSFQPRRSRLRTLAAAALLALLVAACNAGGSPNAAATVNGGEISNEEVAEQYEAFTQNPQVQEQLAVDEDGQMEAQLQAQILTGLIQSRLLQQGAEELGVTVTDEDVDAQREQIIEQVGGEEEFQAILEQNQLTEEDVRSQLRDVALQEAVSEELTGDVEVGDQEVQDYYEANYGQASARHILLESEEEAQEVLDELEAGEDFGELAQQRSVDPSAEENAGDLGEFQRGDMVPEFSEAVFAAEEGETIGPVESQFGFHVIEVQSIDEGPPLEDVEDEIRTQLAQGDQGEAFGQWIQERSAEAEVEVNPRYGEWDAEMGQVVPVGDPLGEPESPGDPGAEPVDPGAEPADPGAEPADPGAEPADPGAEPVEPADEEAPEQ